LPYSSLNPNFLAGFAEYFGDNNDWFHNDVKDANVSQKDSALKISKKDGVAMLPTP
jgi:hypothetical protein